MAGITGFPNPSAKLTTGFLNSQNDPAPGVPLSTAQVSGSIVQPYTGMLGMKIELSADDATKLSVSGFQLFGGIYQYVRFSSAAVVAQLLQGRLVFWDTSVAEDLYQVNNLESLNGGQPYIAGAVLNPAAFQLSAGNYGWIQIAGRTTLKCRTTVTNATRNIQWAAAGAGTDNAAVDGAANGASVLESGAVATTVSGGLMQYIGVSESVAANAGLIVVGVKPGAFTWRY